MNIKEHGAVFHRFDVLWTPTVLIMDAGGVERARLEGYLPRDEFRAWMEAGLGRLAFTAKKWADAERQYGEVAQRYPNTDIAPEAAYWRAVSHYKGTNDHIPLGEVAQELKQRYPDSIWTKKASVWAG